MKNMLQKGLMLLFAITVISNADAVNARKTFKKRTVTTENPAIVANTGVSTLDAIAEQAKTMVNAKGTVKQVSSTRNTAKREINRLMNDLESGKRKQIQPLVNDLLKDPSRETLLALMAGITVADFQADVINVMEEGRKNIERSGGDPEVIKQAVENVQMAEAKAEEAGMMSRIMSGTKSVISAPGNYFFGEERTAAKTAFEVAVGSAAIAAAAYGTYLVGPKAAQAAKGLYARWTGTPEAETTSGKLLFTDRTAEQAALFREKQEEELARRSEQNREQIGKAFNEVYQYGAKTGRKIKKRLLKGAPSEQQAETLKNLKQELQKAKETPGRWATGAMEYSQQLPEDVRLNLKREAGPEGMDLSTEAPEGESIIMQTYNSWTGEGLKELTEAEKIAILDFAALHPDNKEAQAAAQDVIKVADETKQATQEQSWFSSLFAKKSVEQLTAEINAKEQERQNLLIEMNSKLPLTSQEMRPYSRQIGRLTTQIENLKKQLR